MTEMGTWVNDSGTIEADSIMVGVARIWGDDEEMPEGPTHVALEVAAQVVPNWPPVKVIVKLSLDQAVHLRDSVIASVEAVRKGAVPEVIGTYEPTIKP